MNDQATSQSRSRCAWKPRAAVWQVIRRWKNGTTGSSTIPRSGRAKSKSIAGSFRRFVSIAKRHAACWDSSKRTRIAFGASRAIRNIPAAEAEIAPRDRRRSIKSTDPERIRYPLKRIGKRGEGKWERVDLGRSTRRYRRRACAKRFKKSGATRSCTTSAGPAMSCFIISGFFTPGASTATTATPTSAPPARAPAMPFGRASTGRRRIMPTRASFCCSARIWKPGTTSIRTRSGSSKQRTRGTKICVIDTRLSNTASKADYWISSWPGSEGGDSSGDVQYHSAGRSIRSRVRAPMGQLGGISARGAPRQAADVPNFHRRSEGALRPIHARSSPPKKPASMLK